jgi:hypothetical protein
MMQQKPPSFRGLFGIAHLHELSPDLPQQRRYIRASRITEPYPKRVDYLVADGA